MFLLVLLYFNTFNQGYNKSVLQKSICKLVKGVQKMRPSLKFRLRGLCKQYKNAMHIFRTAKNLNLNTIFLIGLGRISGLAGYPAGYSAIFNIRPDAGY